MDHARECNRDGALPIHVVATSKAENEIRARKERPFFEVTRRDYIRLALAYGRKNECRRYTNSRGDIVQTFQLTKLPKKSSIGILGASLCGGLCLSVTGAAQAGPTAEARLTEAWRAAITGVAVPGQGCFTAEYPSTVWMPVACTKAPAGPFVPKRGPKGFVVGNGNDYAAETASPISSAVGSFPSIKGLKQETNEGASDTYTLQLNSSYYVAPVCQGAAVPSECRAWMQYVYSNNSPSAGTAFMEIWLINYGSNCPAGWAPYATDCYYNSNGVNVPNQTLSALGDIQVSGAAVSGGNDTVKVTAAKKAYAVTMPDSMIDLAGNWNTAEYNLFGDGGGSEAEFNPGTKIKVKVQLQDGSTNAPTCITDGFTLESNNLGLNTCKAAGGKKPSITFSESN